MNMAGGASGYTVLIVDDDPAILEMVRDVLEDEDYQVLTARNGQEALRLANDRSPDLIITDLMMPVMSGHVLQRQLRTNTQTLHIPVLVMSAAGHPHDDEFAAFLAKPFDLDTLLQEIRNHLRAPRE
jgi:CheY-like chemotaxis protein